MDGFGDNFDQADVDPAAEFLAREKDQLAGLEDDITPNPLTNLGGDGNAVNQPGTFIQPQLMIYFFLFFFCPLSNSAYSAEFVGGGISVVFFFQQ